MENRGDTKLAELRKKTEVDWEEKAYNQRVAGVGVISVASIITVLFCLGLLLNLCLPMSTFEKYVLGAMFATVPLLAVNGISGVYFSYNCGKIQAKNGLLTITVTSGIVALLNITTLGWMTSGIFNTIALITSVLALASAIVSFIESYNVYGYVTNDQDFALKASKGGNQYFLVWNGEYMELYPPPEAKEGQYFNKEDEEEEKEPAAERMMKMREEEESEKWPPSACLECTKGTPLVWSLTQGRQDDYPDGKFTCNSCHEKFDCTEQRWTSIKEQFDICSNCRPYGHPALLPSYAQCNGIEGGHILTWTTSSLGYEARKEKFDCKICSRKENCSEGRWSCLEDQYDICGDCRPYEQKLPMCNKKHELSWNTDPSNNDNSYVCSVCGKAFWTRLGRWHCDNCENNYNVCPADIEPIGAIAILFVGKEKEERTKLLECSKKVMEDKGHTLIWSTERTGYDKKGYKCDICARRFLELSKGRWTCHECKYNVCPECRPQLRVYMRCNMSHQLKWTADPFGDSSETFVCQTCKQERSYQACRWTCVQCKYNVCSLCRIPSSYNYMRQFLQCEAKHPLAFSNTTKDYEDSTYTCATCYQRMPCATGRWSCALCKYDVCLQCRPREETATVPSTLSHILCANKDHVLMWTTKSSKDESKFKCVICQQEQSYTDGVWTCECPYHVCSQCRPFGNVQMMKDYSECNEKAHPLLWSETIPDYSKDKTYKCLKCKEGGKLCSKGRWTCSSGCDYNICEECLTQCEGNSPTDPKGHIMDISILNQGGKSFSCSKCGSDNKCTFGRWFCRFCGYNLCFNCKHPNGALCVLNYNMTCKNGHFFTWTVDGQGYKDMEYKCVSCGGVNECELGRWECECRTNICPKCRPSSSYYTQCNVGHGLKWNNDSKGCKAGLYQCNVCKENRRCVEGRWNCDLCPYDVCSLCRPPVPTSFLVQFMACSKMDTLLWSTAEYHGGKYRCAICKKSNLLCQAGRWNCDKCDYDVCPACKPTFLRAREDGLLPASNLIQCFKGHLLLLSKTDLGYGEKQFRCQSCKRRMDCSIERWNCGQCKYNICTACRPVTCSITTLSPYIQCNMGHPLNWAPDPINKTFCCAICSPKEEKCKDGRWSCERCKYNVCSKCRSNDSKFLCDKEMHVLSWSISNKGCRNKEYRCNVCSRTENCMKGRWNCEQCAYNVCFVCRNNGGFAFSFVKLVDPKNHGLVWTSSEEGCEGSRYKCSMCNRGYNCAVKRWTCIPCKYNICSNCRPSKAAYLSCEKCSSSLVWSANPLYDADENSKCSICRKNNIVTGGRWECSGCRYYICTTCRPPSSPDLITPYIKCKSDHLLTWTNDFEENPKSTFVCATCGRNEIPCSSWRWNCKKCKYDVCSVCRPMDEPTMALSKEETVPRGRLIECRKGHILRRSISSKRFKCDICLRERTATDEWWNCEECKYNVCLKCREANECILVATEYLQCERSHTLQWNNRNNKLFVCKACGKLEKDNKERWNCELCEYDICNQCRPYSNIEKLDTLGHRLNWSYESVGYPYERYSCGMCRTIEKCSEGRWNCPQCLYDICPACRQPFTPVLCTSRNTDSFGHKLIWTRECIQENEHEFVCTRCSEKKVLKEGRWACIPCKNNICNKCKPISRNILKCPFDHELVWSYKIGEVDNFICACCCQEHKQSQGRWCCSICDKPGQDKKYQICQNCRPSLSTNSIDSLIKCRKEHILAWSLSEEEYKNKEYKCNICGAKGSCPDGRWHCSICKYDLCQDCRLPSEALLDFEARENARKRLKMLDYGHCMILSDNDTGYTDKKYTCESCKQEKLCSEKRWSCVLECKVDICLKCRPQKDDAACLIPMIGQCNLGHAFSWSSEPKEMFKMTFNCSMCKQESINVKEGRWVCEKGDTEICNMCRAPDSNICERMKCPSKHQMKWTYDYAGYLFKRFACAGCKNEMPCQEGRFICKPCNLEMCRKCTMPTSGIVFASITKCNNNHPLLMEDNVDQASEPNYVCQKCKKEVDSKKGRWSCKSCKYNVCYDCKPHMLDYCFCESSHLLVWNTTWDKEKYTEGEYNCTLCRKVYKCKEGRWTCTKCEPCYDVCQDCRPSCNPKNIDVFVQCTQSHLLKWSKESKLEQYPDGTYICRLCANSGKCNEGRWCCAQDMYDVCPCCRPNLLDPKEEEAPKLNLEALKLESSEEIKERKTVEDTVSPLEISPDSDRKSVEDNSSTQGLSTPSMIEVLSRDIKQIIQSKQLEEIAAGYRIATLGKKVAWKNTWFIYVIDSSGSMRGPRWTAVKNGYKRSLSALTKMEEIYITTFTFDDKPNQHIHFKPPAQALKDISKLPFGGKGTNYIKAMDSVVDFMQKKEKKYEDYLTCIFFLSDGQGGYPEKAISTLSDMRKAGSKMVFFTIACATDEEADMIKMTTELKGEHYKVINQKATEAVFLKILTAFSN